MRELETDCNGWGWVLKGPRATGRDDNVEATRGATPRVERARWDAGIVEGLGSPEDDSKVGRWAVEREVDRAVA